MYGIHDFISLFFHTQLLDLKSQFGIHSQIFHSILPFFDRIENIVTTNVAFLGSVF
jgi:hypothetical protein